MESMQIENTGCDEYVLRHPRSAFHHLSGWGDALCGAFKFHKMYLTAKADGRVCGVLPLILVDTFLGKKLISVPLGVSAGILSDSEFTEKALLNEAIELTKKLGCGYLELRNARRLADPRLRLKDLYMNFIRELPNKKEECIELMPRKARAAARHASDKGLAWDTGIKYLDDFYEIYSISQKYLGTPVIPRQWLEKLTEIFKDKIDIFVVKFDGRCIAGVFTLFYKDTVLPFYGGSIPKFSDLKANNYMYLKMQEYGIEKGYRYFDFGRSKIDSGSYYFKINQGFVPTPLYYQYYLNKAKEVPNISPANPIFNLPKTAWKYLPLSVTKWLSPKIFKYVMP